MKNRGPGAINRVYRLVWNEETGAFVAVSELAMGRRKSRSGVSRLIAAALLIAGGSGLAQAQTPAATPTPPAATALPHNGTLVQGQAQWGQSGAAKLDINQASNKAAINWQSFNIGAQAQVNIQQPSSGAMLLNRVTGADVSQILGKLTANGQVVLVNPNGIVFSKGVQVDVGGLVASTLKLSDADFMAGKLRFERGTAAGSVSNQGNLQAHAGGYIALLAPEVLNDGVIRAQLGSIALAGGEAVTLSLQGSQLLGIKVDDATVKTLIENRQLLQADGGQVILAAGAAHQLLQQAIAGSRDAQTLVEQDGVVRLVSNTGQVSATAGQVHLQGGNVDVGGQVQATQGGTVSVQADYVGQSGQIDVSSTLGRGGHVQVQANTLVQTAQASIHADGMGGGGQIRLEGATGSATASTLYSSAVLSAQGVGAGTLGGAIDMTAGSVQLRAAQVDASGVQGGGRVRVGGGFHGADADLSPASQVGINGATALKADATGSHGDGGQVVVWSDQKTVFGGSLSAHGGRASGAGGQAEVSGKQDLVFQGTADLSSVDGRAGQLLLDPRNIVIDDAGVALAGLAMSDPTPSSTNGFGTAVQVLDNGNVVVTAPSADTGASTATGAVYLFNSSTGALLSNLRGSNAGDKVGSGGLKLLSNNHYLVLSPEYGTVSGKTVVSFDTEESSGTGAARAPSKTYPLVSSATASAGAITWQSKAGSGSGLVSSSNSLVGSTANTDTMTPHGYSGSTVTNLSTVTVTANDRVGGSDVMDSGGSYLIYPGTKFTELSDGNMAIAMPGWFNGRGAVAWMNASTGVLANGSAGGAVSASTALVGSTANRTVAPVSTAVSDSTKKVYVTGVDSTSYYSYTDGGANRRSSPPGSPGDMVGTSVIALPNGGYVVSSPLWTNGAATYSGAVTWGASGGSTGTVGSANSLVGSSSYDFVGSGGVSLVGASSTNYVVASPYWSGNGNAAAGRFLENSANGAVTWVDGSNGRPFGSGSSGAAVGVGNSLIGGAGDFVGSYSNAAGSPYTAYDYNSSTNISSSSTSTRTQAAVSGGLKVLKNGNYLAIDTGWSSSKGSVTFADGSTGVAGGVSSTNSLVGSTASDKVGKTVLELSGSHYAVASPDWDNGATVDVGAVTWGSGTTGRTGAVSSSNSLVGSGAYDAVGTGGLLAVGATGANGLRTHYLVLSPQWGNRAGASDSTVAYGAVTWVDGTSGQALGASSTGAAVSSANSLVGNHAGDYVGSVHYADSRAGNYTGLGYYNSLGSWYANLTASVDVLSNGDYVVRSPNWDSGKGAVTWASGSTGAAGTLSSANSLVGTVADVTSTSTATQSRGGINWTDTTTSLTTTGDHVGLLGGSLAGGHYLAISPFWGSGKGAVTWIGSGNHTGTVDATNSVVGSTADVFNNANHTTLVSTGDRLGTLASTQWATPVIAQATVSGSLSSPATMRPVGPYASTTASDSINWGTNVVMGKSYSVQAPVTLQVQDDGWGNWSTGFQFNVTPVYKQLSNGNVLVASPNWVNSGASAANAGAVTWLNGSNGQLIGGSQGGVLSASNSLVGSHAGDYTGYRLPLDGVKELSNGNFVLVNSQWYSERGAVTWGSGTAGVSGTISSSNSLVGTTPSSNVNGTTTYQKVAGFSDPSDYLYRFVDGKWSYDWPDKVTSKDGDRIGFGGVTALPDGNAVVASPFWGSTAAWTQLAAPSSKGAATWINGGTGALHDGSTGGAVSATNSLVGAVAGDAVAYSAYIDGSSGTHYVASGVTALAGGRYVVASPWWSNGAATGVGAVTFGATGGVVGTVSASNSLVGATAGDHVGQSLSMLDPVTWVSSIDNGVQVVTSGGQTHYVVRSYNWTNTADVAAGGAGAGAVTWVNGTTGIAYGESSVGAKVNVTNSLVGTSAGDAVGAGFTALTRQVGSSSVATGDLLFFSNYNSCDAVGEGAVTLLSGAKGAAGEVGWRNSLLGLAPTSNGQVTSTLTANSFSSDIRVSVLPTAVTSAEAVNYRPLVWATPNTTSGNNSSSVHALTLVNESAVSGAVVDPIHNAGGANWTGSLFADGSTGFNNVGGTASTGLLGFSANASSDVVITPATLTGLLNAGTNVTLQANNDITVQRNITVSAGGHGGDLTLEAGRSVRLNANISTDNGDLTVVANQSVANGVVNADCGTCVAEIVQRAGSVVDAGTGTVSLTLAKSTDKTSNAAGDIHLASVDAAHITVVNAGLDASANGQGIRFESGSVIGSADTQTLTLQAGGASTVSGGLVLASDTQLVGAAGATLQVAAADASAQVKFGTTSGGFVMSAAEMGKVISQSSGYTDLQFGRTDQTGATTFNGLDFTQAAMRRGAATLDANVTLQGGSGGVTVAGTVKSGAATGRDFKLLSQGGTLALGNTALTASTGYLELATGSGGSVTQTTSGAITAANLLLSGTGSATLNANANAITTVAGQIGSATVKNAASTLTVGSVAGVNGLTVSSGAVLQAAGASSDVVLNQAVSSSSGDVVLAAGRNFLNNNATNTGLSVGTGRYLVYSTNPTASTEAMTGYAKHYNQTYTAGSTPAYASTGNWFLYSVAPTLTASVGSGATVTYGDPGGVPGVSLSGLIDGDTLASATTGSLASTTSSYTASGAGFIPVGTYTVNLTGQGTLTSPLGYQISVTSGSSSFTVQPKAISASGLTASSKVYDGTTSTSVTGSATLQSGGATNSDGRALTGDTVSISGTATGTFNNKNVGTGKSVVLSGLTLSGADAANYTISAGSVTADITAKSLTVNGSSAANKVYDGATTATVSGGTLSGVVGSDVVTLTQAGVFADKNVGTGKAVTVQDSLGGADAVNYTLVQPTGVTADITRKSVTIFGATASHKVYDGTTAATVGGGSINGLESGDTVNLVGTFGDKNAGTGKVVSFGLGGTDAGNYEIDPSIPFMAMADITPKSVVVSGATASNKVYDGLTTATVTGGSVSGLIGSDAVSVGGAFADKNVGTGKTVNLSLGGLDASNYQIDTGGQTSTTASITPKSLTVSGTSVTSKAYDGTTTATVVGGALSGVVSSDAVTLSEAGVFSDKNAGTGKAVTVQDSLAGADAGNYTLVQPTGVTGDITRKVLDGGGMALSKVYDGTTTAMFIGSLTGWVGSEQVGLAGSFSDKDVGTGKTVTFYLTGAAASNYEMRPGQTSSSADITPKAVLVSGATASNKVYDGTTTATVSGGSVSGLIGSDTVSVGGAFSDKNVGTGKTVNLSLGGTASSNYTIDLGGQTSAAADITPKSLTVSGTVAAHKVYDGTTAATVSGGSLLGVVGGDVVTLSEAGVFLDKNAGVGKAVTVQDSLLGTDASNYSVVQPTGVSADITRKVVAVNGATASNKVYDGTTTATVSGGSISGLIGGDTVDVGGVFGDKNAGTGKTVNLNLGGTDAGNYEIDTSGQTSTTADITRKVVTVSGATASNKVYDGTTTATVSGGNVSGLIGGDTVALGGVFGDKNAGTGKTVNLNLGGTDAGNYEIDTSGQTSTTADITRKSVTVSGATASNKVYDGTTTATVSGGSVSGLVGGDTVSVGGAFGDKNAGTGKTVNLNLGGTDADNYELDTSGQTSATADITRKSVTVSGATASNKVYDGTTTATVSGGSVSGLIGGDTVNVGGAFGDKNAGAGKTVNLNLGGSDAGNYEIDTSGQTSTAADITRKVVTVSGATASNKVYDGTTTATVSGGNVSGLIGGDTVALGGAFGDKNAGTGKAVSLNLGGTDAGNYELDTSGQTSATADITRKSVTVSGATASNKVYDGTTAATVSGGNIGGLVGGDAVSVGGVFDTKNAGTGKAVSLNLGGADADNYELDASGQTRATADITRKSVTVSGATASNKVYDGTTTATVSGGNVSGLIGGDAVNVGGAFGDKNAGTGKTVSLNLGGTDADNYEIDTRGQTSTAADIARKSVTVSGATASNKVYDGTTTATVANGQVSGALNGDTLSVVGAFDNQDVGSGKRVGLTLSGAASGNYSLDTAGQTSVTADITAQTSSGVRSENLQTQVVNPTSKTQETLLSGTAAAGTVVTGSANTNSSGQSTLVSTFGAGSLSVLGGGVATAGSGASSGSAGFSMGFVADPSTSTPADNAGSAGAAGRGGTGASGTVGSTGAAGAAGGGNSSVNPDAVGRLLVNRPVLQVKAQDVTSGIACQGLFERPEGMNVTYSASLSGGRPLPAWLSIDSKTGVLKGQPPAGVDVDKLEVVVAAKSTDAQTATSTVQLQWDKP